MQSLKKFSTHEILPYAEEIIKSGRKARIPVSGNSMRPFIVDNRDEVLITGIRYLKKGDIILFKNNRGEYILHRICCIKNMKYRTIGDYCLKDDGVVEWSDIIGVVETLIRKGKTIDCDSYSWRLFSRLWLALLPIRKYLISSHIVFTRVKARIKRGKPHITYMCMSCIRFIKTLFNKGGWLSRHD